MLLFYTTKVEIKSSLLSQKFVTSIGKNYTSAHCMQNEFEEHLSAKAGTVLIS